MSDLRIIYGNIIVKLKDEIAQNEEKHKATLEKEREAAHFVVRRLEDAINDLKEAIAKYKEGENEREAGNNESK
jgi:exonuclease VII small subunit